MSFDLQVVPIDDLIAHEDSEECPCGPELQPVERDDGGISWILSHHSLDGRELHE